MIARALAAFLLLAVPAAATDAIRIVYLGLDGDSYYEPQPVYTGLSLKDRPRPVEGVLLGQRDTRVLGRALGLSFEFEEVFLKGEDAPSDVLADLSAEGATAVLLDLPGDEMRSALSGAVAGDIVINIRDGSAGWRDADCVAGLFHTIPSDAMLSDALAQHLKARGWDRVLMLVGPHQDDAADAETARRSAAKFGLTIAEERAFVLANDPRQRDQSNLDLLTGGVRYDVVWLVDSEGDFGRFLPFATHDPRPVVGSEGLRPLAWHWTLERYGAPQLNQRFRRLADRDMTSGDWAAWVAVRAVAEAATAAGSAEKSAIREALSSPDLSVDLYKGVRGNFRSWNGQMRQPVVLATHNAVIGIAPLEGFTHQTDVLDTLGLDREESRCADRK
jgi:ABC transporter substrate binding protein (PQQ-dependent alcohol dehydrogenase system)